MEITLPNERGHLQILNIHMVKMRENQVMESDVSLEELANLTKSFSDAEISSLIKSAMSFAFNRHVKVSKVELQQVQMFSNTCRSG
jgi:vesicle-fusing ATPase